MKKQEGSKLERAGFSNSTTLREVGLEKLEDSDVIESSTGKVFRSAPIERELKVIRILPNPRMVLCEYWELESRRTCIVNVGKNRKWVRGMKFVMEEPGGELEFAKPWEYTGKQPRRRGRW